MSQVNVAGNRGPDLKEPFMAYCKTLLSAATVALMLALPAGAQDATPEVTADTVVATVDGVDITIGHMIAMRMSLSEQNLQLPDEVIFEGVLERIIQQRAVSQSVAELDKATELAIANETSALIASARVTELAEAIEITDEQLQTAYEAEYADFVPIKEFNASHILVETEEEAIAIVAELEAGADFGEVARQKSTGPSNVNGGNLGWQGPGRLVKPFEDAALALEPGGVSAPVQTQFGWHVIKLNETRLPETPSLDSVRADLEAKIWETELRAQIAALVDAANVERPDLTTIDPAVLRDMSLIGR